MANIEGTFAEVRETIDALRAAYPGCENMRLALAAMAEANAYEPQSRKHLLLALTAMVLHFAEKHTR